MSITCRSCQSPNPEGTSYCIVCGNELPKSSTGSESEQTLVADLSSANEESSCIEIPEAEIVVEESVAKLDVSNFDWSSLPELPASDNFPMPIASEETLDEPEIEASANPLTATFLIAKQPNIGTFLLESDAIAIIGRFDPDTGPVDIDLDNYIGNETVSRLHAEIYFESEQWKVKDLGSTNGVFIKRFQGRHFEPRISAPTVICTGDEIAFGKIRFTLQQK